MKSRSKKSAKQPAISIPVGVGDLTPRELDVIVAVGAHHTYDEIGQSLGVSYETVKSYMARLRNKLGIRRKSELTQWSINNRSRLTRRLAKLKGN